MPPAGLLLRLGALLALWLAALPAFAASVLFIATSNVPAGKFRQLAEIARPHGIALEVRYLDRLPADVDHGLFRGHDVVFVDSYLHDQVRARLARALPGLAAPQLWLYDAKPHWSGLPDALAKRLVAYYASGGRANFEGFFASLAAHLAGRPADGIAAPVVFPKAAVYHPRAPGSVVADPREWLASQGAAGAPGHRPPVIAIALHQQYLSSMQTDFVDDLIERIEAGGAVALPFYGPMLDDEVIGRMLMPDGVPLADVLINTQIMLNAEGRRRDFEALGIPVVQAMPYRRGDAADWAADPHGVRLMDVPFYLAQAEYAGVVDIQVAAATRRGDEQMVPIPAQAAAVVGKALRLAALQRKPNADKRVTVMFWNYPPGEKNLSASFLNAPRSLLATLDALQAAGYRTAAPGDETVLLPLLQRLLAPHYRDDADLDALARDGLAALLPVSDYEAWLATLPAAVQREVNERWGAPERSAMVLRRGGQAFFAIPRLALGHVVLMPQPPRGERSESKEKALYHSVKAAPSHFYLAAYLWARQAQRSDALVHFGTHGTQEWLPGKERGLAVTDYPMLAVGDVPVVYPYIADNIGEAQQAKRRGRAVIVSHQTPTFKPAGLHAELTRLHDLLHAWIAQDEGAVKERLRAELLAAAAAQRIDRDMGWTAGEAAGDFPRFVDALHAQLHELAETVQPLGLHTFGRAPQDGHRLATVLLMLGRPFWEAAARHAGTPEGELDEALVGEYDQLAATAPYRLLVRHVLHGEPAGALPAPLQAWIEQAHRWHADLGAAQELPALLAALAGRHLPTSYGGDPVKNPDAYPTGRNLYGFDPSRIPTPQAWAAGREAADKLLAEHRRQHGRLPKKLTFSLWSVETMRHQGLLEAQALWLLGVEPQWDAGGRVTGVKRVPREQLGRPRVDVVLSATGLYRDHFPNAMKQLARAVQLAAQADEADNPVAANARRIAAGLRARGVPEAAARLAGETRIFSSESGRYGTGLDDATLATDTWQGKAEGDRKLAQLYLARMQFAYGPDEAGWGRAGAGAPGGGDAAQAVNLYAEHLRGTEGAVLSRTSNLYGMLTTDDPFQYLGGIALAVRHLDGKAPALYISNLRGAGSGRVEGAAQFLAKELATRQFHPGYIKGLMAEGYAGTLQVLDATNNFWGWTAVAREIVRDDQWQEMVDVYVRDKHRLGLDRWFERHNPHALAQTIERMLEAARQGYWQADAATVDELKTRWRDLARRFDVRSDNARFAAFVGYGLDAPAAPAAQPRAAAPAAAAPPAQEPPPPAPQPPVPPPVSGLRLERVEPAPAPVPPWPAAWLALALAAAAAAGAAGRARGARAAPPAAAGLRTPIHQGA